MKSVAQLLSAEVIGASLRICNPQRLRDMLQVAQRYSRGSAKGIYFYCIESV
jgi:hypothetical protein